VAVAIKQLLVSMNVDARIGPYIEIRQCMKRAR